jgi:hypothetical protein
LQKEIKKYQDAYEKEKYYKECEEKNWLVKYDRIVEKYEGEMK